MLRKEGSLWLDRASLHRPQMRVSDADAMVGTRSRAMRGRTLDG